MQARLGFERRRRSSGSLRPGWHSINVKRMKFRLAVEYDDATQRWSAVFPELPGCGSAGDTEEEAVRNAKEALQLWFDPSPIELARNAKLIEVTLP